MGLMKLLSAGKSLVGIREGRSKYRVTTANLVPIFNESDEPARVARAEKSRAEKRRPGRNPFDGAQELESKPTSKAAKLIELPDVLEAEPASPKSELVSKSGSGERRVGTAAADAPAAADTRPEPEMADVPVATPEASRTVRPARRPKGAAAVTSVPAPARVREPVLVVAERKRKRKPKPAVFAKLARLSGLVRGAGRKPSAPTRESWLRRLRVVRNDLTDADLEVVPAGGAKSHATPAASAKSSRGAVARFVRSRKLARLVTSCFAWI